MLFYAIRGVPSDATRRRVTPMSALFSLATNLATLQYSAGVSKRENCVELGALGLNSAICDVESIVVSL